MILIDLIDERQPEARPKKETGRDPQAAACPGNSQENMRSSGCLEPQNDQRQQKLGLLCQAERLLRSIPWLGMLRSLL
jgi:hypothetical protein